MSTTNTDKNEQIRRPSPPTVESSTTTPTSSKSPGEHCKKYHAVHLKEMMKKWNDQDSDSEIELIPDHILRGLTGRTIDRLMKEQKKKIEEHRLKREAKRALKAGSSSR